MVNYFRNYSSNTHQVCCEDSPTKGLYYHRQSDDLAQGHRRRREWRERREEEREVFVQNIVSNDINISYQEPNNGRQIIWEGKKRLYNVHSLRKLNVLIFITALYFSTANLCLTVLKKTCMSGVLLFVLAYRMQKKKKKKKKIICFGLE